MNRSDFQSLTRLRVREARQLLAGRCFEGSYYLLGYAVECGLKSCIAKQTRRYDFPDKDLAMKVYKHDLTLLLRHSGLEPRFHLAFKKNAKLERNWSMVKDWNEQYRYDLNITEQKTRQFHAAVLSDPDGVLVWLQKYW